MTFIPCYSWKRYEQRPTVQSDLSCLWKLWRGNKTHLDKMNDPIVCEDENGVWDIVHTIDTK